MGADWRQEEENQQEQWESEMESKQVYPAITAITAAMAKEGIAKSSRNTQGAGFNFRGIDDVLNALAGLLAAHGLCILPRVVSREQVERQSKAGGALFYTTIEVEFDLVSSADGSTHTVKTFGEAMDSGDKSTNKAMSAAYKYMALQTFCIPTKGDNDADATTHEVMAKPTPAKSVARDTFDKLPPDVQDTLRNIAMDVVALMLKADVAGAVAFIDEQGLDADSKVGLWSLLDSTQRAAIKKHQDSLKLKEAA
jgi:hypothetical protein